MLTRSISLASVSLASSKALRCSSLMSSSLKAWPLRSCVSRTDFFGRTSSFHYLMLLLPPAKEERPPSDDACFLSPKEAGTEKTTEGTHTKRSTLHGQLQRIAMSDAARCDGPCTALPHFAQNTASQRAAPKAVLPSRLPCPTNPHKTRKAWYLMVPRLISSQGFHPVSNLLFIQ